MVRQAREKSENGIYHVMVRGINHQDIFYDDEDNIRFLNSIQRVKQINGCVLHGFCLMDNHVHMLLQEHQEDIAVTMKRLCTGYARWYNWKYERSGHLFQNRYKSEPIEDDIYLLTVIRYIHNNPVKASLVRIPEEWKWSSCKAYYDARDNSQEMTDTTKILGLFSNDTSEAVFLFRKYMGEDNTDHCLENEPFKRRSDSEVAKEIEKIIGNIPAHLILKMPKAERNEILRSLKQMEGISCRQIGRVLGISPSLILKL
jgi:REP element-mobilizing transposase RayT